jgi:hypothetical protein
MKNENLMSYGPVRYAYQTLQLHAARERYIGLTEEH